MRHAVRGVRRVAEAEAEDHSMQCKGGSQHAVWGPSMQTLTHTCNAPLDLPITVRLGSGLGLGPAMVLWIFQDPRGSPGG